MAEQWTTPLPPMPARSRTGRSGLRVAVIAPPYFPVPPSGYGGIERVVAALVDGLAARGHDITLVAAAGSSGSGRVVSPLPTSPVLGDPSSVTAELCHSLWAYRRATDFDVIHDHTNLGAPLGSLLDGRTRVVHTLHGPWTTEARRLYALVDDRLSLVAISNTQRADNPAVRYAGVVHNGIDTGQHPLRTAKDDFLVFVGRTCPEKRPDVAIEVARRAGLPLKMIIKRSEPSESRYWDEVVAPRLGSDVEVLDQPPHPVKVELMGRARALLFPISWPEPFGLVMTEAMACGTPVIARPLGAAPEVIVDGVTGFLCRSAREMVAAVARSGCIDPRACRQVVQDRFSTESMVDGYERVYSAVATGAGRSRALSAGS